MPIPKKRDLQYRNNWHGISLLDVVGKLSTRVIQERLQVIVCTIYTRILELFQKG